MVVACLQVITLVSIIYVTSKQTREKVEDTQNESELELKKLKNKLAASELVVSQLREEVNSIDAHRFDSERSALQKKIAVLQTKLLDEQSAREELEQRLSSSPSKQRISDLELKLSREQSARETAEKRVTAAEAQLKKFSEDSQHRLDRARSNFQAGRWRTYPAPDGSNRNFCVTYDERGADVISPTMRARFQAGQ